MMKEHRRTNLLAWLDKTAKIHEYEFETNEVFRKPENKTHRSKKCNGCGIIKYENNFHKDRSKRDGLKNRCKLCCHFYAKEYRKTPTGQKLTKRHNHKWKETKEGREKVHDRQKKYNDSARGKLIKSLYRKSEAGKKAERKYQQSEKCKANIRLRHRKIKQKKENE